MTHEELCCKIVAETQEAVIFADREGIIRLWNAGAEAMFGYSAEEANGQSLDLIIPDRQRAPHWEGYRKVMETGTTRYGRELLAVPAIRKDGSRISLEFSIMLLREGAEKLTGAVAIMREVTARWQQDKALKQRVAALEAQVSHSQSEKKE
ncbi:MAG: PAS domain-containing protein [Candidatus Binatia bacterium]